MDLSIDYPKAAVKSVTIAKAKVVSFLSWFLGSLGMIEMAGLYFLPAEYHSMFSVAIGVLIVASAIAQVPGARKIMSERLNKGDLWTPIEEKGPNVNEAKAIVRMTEKDAELLNSLITQTGSLEEIKKALVAQ